MKITRTSQAALSAQQRSQLANAGCKVCPCCGETKSEMEYFKEGIYNKGVFGGLICKQWAEGLFRTRHMRIDCYSCSTCGAQWESEAYEIERKMLNGVPFGLSYLHLRQSLRWLFLSRQTEMMRSTSMNCWTEF